MGQYHVVVNLDRQEYLEPHRLGDGAKFAEQLCTYGGTPAALYILLGASAAGMGGGDIEQAKTCRWNEEAKRFEWVETDPEWNRRLAKWVGRWAGQRIAVVGCYTKPEDLPTREGDPPADRIYHLCTEGVFRDITAEIIPILERACRVRIEEKANDFWRRRYVGPGDEPPVRVLMPDTLIESQGVGVPPVMYDRPFIPVGNEPPEAGLTRRRAKRTRQL